MDGVDQQNVQCDWYEMWKRKIVLCEDSSLSSLLGIKRGFNLDMKNVMFLGQNVIIALESSRAV